MKKLPEVLMGTGFVLVAFALLFGWIIVPGIINDQITQQVRLKQGSEVWEMWSDPPIPIYLKIYLFNVSNPEDVARGRRPKLSEVGPFVYQERRIKVDVEALVEEGTVKYKQRIYYTFSKQLSVGKEDDVLTVLNVAFLAISQKISELPMLIRELAASYILTFDETLFVERTVEEILFKGRFEPMIDGIQKMTGMEIVPNSTFGFFLGKNGTHDGEIQIHSGVKDANQFGEIVSWEGKQKLDWWNGEYCNMINGTDGSLFPPFMTRSNIIYIFNSDICRSIYLTYKEDVEFMGVSAYRFTPPKAMFEDSRINEDNRCFCTKTDSTEKCLLAGVMSLESCREGAPIVMSTPHFLDGDSLYINNTGLSPNRNKHETLVDIQPMTGVVLQAFKRIQFNVELKRLKTIPAFRKVEPMLFPLFWIEESASIDAANIETLNSRLLTPLRVVKILKWTIVTIGWVLNLAAILVIVVRLRRSKEFI